MSFTRFANKVLSRNEPSLTSGEIRQGPAAVQARLRLGASANKRVQFAEDVGPLPRGCKCTPLGLALLSSDPALLDVLLAGGADPNKPVGLPHRFNFAPLHLAAALGREEAVRKLLAAGADPNTRLEKAGGFIKSETAMPAVFKYTAPGDTPLHLAVDCNSAASDGCGGVVGALLEDERTNPNTRNTAGRTPLNEACKRKATQAVQMLTRHPRVDVNASGPLFAAISAESTELVRLLLAAGASVCGGVKNQDGQSPLGYAVFKGSLTFTNRAEVVGLLMGAGAAVESGMVQHAADWPKVREALSAGVQLATGSSVVTAGSGSSGGGGVGVGGSEAAGGASPAGSCTVHGEPVPGCTHSSYESPCPTTAGVLQFMQDNVCCSIMFFPMLMPFLVMALLIDTLMPLAIILCSFLSIVLPVIALLVVVVFISTVSLLLGGLVPKSTTAPSHSAAATAAASTNISAAAALAAPTAAIAASARYFPRLGWQGGVGSVVGVAAWFLSVMAAHALVGLMEDAARTYRPRGDRLRAFLEHRVQGRLSAGTAISDAQLSLHARVCLPLALALGLGSGLSLLSLAGLMVCVCVPTVAYGVWVEYKGGAWEAASQEAPAAAAPVLPAATAAAATATTAAAAAAGGTD